MNTLTDGFPSVALQVTFHEALKNSLLCLITLVLHDASEPDILHIGLCTSSCLCFTSTQRLCIDPRGPSYIPYVRSLQSFTSCVWGRVSCCLQRIATESGDSTSNTHTSRHVCEYIQTHANTAILQTRTPVFPFASEEI